MPVCIQHQNCCIYAAKSLFGAYLMLIRCLFFQCLHLTANFSIYAAKSLFGSYLTFSQRVFGAKLLHVCRKILMWCLVDAYFCQCLHSTSNCCKYAGKSLFGAYLMLIQCLFLPMPNCCIYAGKSLLGAFLMLIQCLFLSMFALLHICSKIHIWRFF